jgi:hypothetical protein
MYLEITIIQPEHQKKDSTTRPILHPFSSDLLLPIFESFTAHHIEEQLTSWHYPYTSHSQINICWVGVPVSNSVGA